MKKSNFIIENNVLKKEEKTMSYSVEQRNAMKKALENMQNLFGATLFSCFTVRMLDTLGYILTVKNRKEGIEYVRNYLSLCEPSRVNEINQKINNPEFKAFLDVWAQFPISKKRWNNDRLEFYFGPTGSGKLDKIYKKYKVEGTFCCNNNIRAFPEDIRPNEEEEDIVILSNSSTLRRAMEEGRAIIFDEINLLSYSAAKFLDELIKSKDEFMCNNELIKINKNFKIICTTPLPSDLVKKGCMVPPFIDKASEIKRCKKQALVYKKKTKV